MKHFLLFIYLDPIDPVNPACQPQDGQKKEKLVVMQQPH